MELRWLNVKRQEWMDGSDIPKCTYERVLQFRSKEGPHGEDWWGEWQDLPEAYTEI
jgi:hypothetical protein